MQLARVRVGSEPTVVIVEGTGLVTAQIDGQTFADLPALIAAADGTPGRITGGARVGTLGELALLAPVARPRKIICVGLNYRLHAAETGAAVPEAPPLFPKWDNAIVGHNDPVRLPAESSRVDYEAELTFIIGRRCRRVAAADAGSVLFGYTAANDVSARDLQMRTSQWGAGKAFDDFCPLGPVVTTADVLGPSPDLAIRGRLNGELVQDSRTNDLIYDVPTLVEFISSIMTLEPGDIVLTGTPSGVGNAKNPPRFMQPGDVYEVEIEGIGTLRNQFVAG